MRTVRRLTQSIARWWTADARWVNALLNMGENDDDVARLTRGEVVTVLAVVFLFVFGCGWLEGRCAL